MKKFISILTLIIFSLNTIGFSVNSHMCKMEGNSYSISFYANEKKSCCGKKSTSCCKDNIQFVKLKDNYTHSKTNHVSTVKLYSSTFYLLPEASTLVLNLTLVRSIDYSPPFPSVSFSILYSVFRIWFFCLILWGVLRHLV